MFYLVVIGWIFRYFGLSVTGMFSTFNPGEFFGGFVGTSSAVPWHLAGVVLTGVIVFFGIQRGIEKAVKIMLPIFLVLMVVLLIRTLTLPGAGEGIRFLLIPEWSKLGEADTWIYALGQALFSVSIGGANMVVYGSYLRKDTDLARSAYQTASFDTIAALFAAFIIIPAAFAFGVEPSAGPPLLFITIPVDLPADGRRPLLRRALFPGDDLHRAFHLHRPHGDSC